MDQVPGKTHSQTDEQITSESKKISISFQYSQWISWGKMERKKKGHLPKLEPCGTTGISRHLTVFAQLDHESLSRVFSAFWWLPCLCPALMFTASFSTRLTAGWQLNDELSTASRHRPRSAVSMRRSLEVPSKNLTSRVKSHGSTLSILTGHLMLE